ncbi:MAG: tetrathionate reductase family octaheme c-type cytochrome [Anaerolineaceae bacterium]|nr:tetrathionate reductase family octaheme c-type cytochrome [Anaerolineaceae bacterium]
MKYISALLIVFGVSLLAIVGVLAQDDASAELVLHTTADHSQFEILQGTFATGPDVTAACLTCHNEAAQQVMATEHWTWLSEDPETGEMLGKQNIINNYCVAIESNEPRCTSCHTGYGWRDETFDFTSETNVDCIVCHDTTGTYKKLPTGAGHPVYEPTVVNGTTWEPPDLAMIAQNVGATSRETCGACHFYGGGDDAVKHGDLDSSLANPEYALDVHMSPDGADFTCSTCHQSEGHQIDGSRYGFAVYDENGIDYPGHDDGNSATCESCHGLAPHDAAAKIDGQDDGGDRLNEHTEFIACQTCHIPEFARAQPTKMFWDWSTAGQRNEDGSIIVTVDEAGDIVYDSRKGSFVWESNVVPEYLWLTGEFDFMTIGEVIDPTDTVYINAPVIDSDHGRLFPVKRFVGLQPYDTVNNTLIVPHLYPYGPDDTTAFWKVWDLNLAFATGMEDAELPYSGEYGYVETVMYWPITHMVAPADDALTCLSCHTDENSRMANVDDVHVKTLGD